VNDNGARDLSDEQEAASVEDNENTQTETQAQAQAESQAQTSADGGQRDLAAEYLDALQRERAAFLNYKRRVEQDREEASYKATANVLKKLLGVVDDFDRAVAHLPEEAKKVPWVEGILAIHRKLNSVLESEGVEKIEAQDKPFDPNLHEAVAFDDTGDGHEDTVAEVYANGYKVRDRVLRPAMVKVSRG
jgi:molecular chaperone GrpE